MLWTKIRNAMITKTALQKSDLHSRRVRATLWHEWAGSSRVIPRPHRTQYPQTQAPLWNGACVWGVALRLRLHPKKKTNKGKEENFREI